jgi:protein-disulfide isomerase
MSYVAAMAAECADDQGKFWELHDAIFAKPDIWT